MSRISLLLFLACAATNWYAAWKTLKQLEYVVKPAALIALLVFAACGPHCSPWLLIALALSLLGDVLLMLPGDYLLAGLPAFLLGNIAYVIDIPAPHNKWRVVWFVVVAVTIWPVALRIVNSIQPFGKRLAVAIYVAVIALMASSALASGQAIAAAGALLFLTSDAMLAWNLFVNKIPHGHFLVMVAYHLGQLGLVLSLR